MDAAERQGLGLAIGGHILLFAILSLGLMLRMPPKPIPHEVMDVQLTGPIGRQSAVPESAREDPAESQAPEQGDPTEAPPSEPTAEPKPAPKPAPEKAVKPTEKPKPTPRERLNDDFLKDIRPSTAKDKPKGQRLGADFLKGITGAKTAGKGQAPRAALSGPQMAGLAAAIAAQIRPCYNIPAGGVDALSIITVLRLRFNPDGSPVGQPTAVDHQGVTPDNQGYVKQMDDAARRAVLRCAPLKLPANLYEGGWDDIEFVFNPKAME